MRLRKLPGGEDHRQPPHYGSRFGRLGGLYPGDAGYDLPPLPPGARARVEEVARNVNVDGYEPLITQPTDWKRHQHIPLGELRRRRHQHIDEHGRLRADPPGGTF